MKAIRTHYLSATNTKGSRIKAVAQTTPDDATSLTFPYDYEADDGGHRTAAEALAATRNWGPIAGYGTTWINGTHYHLWTLLWESSRSPVIRPED